MLDVAEIRTGITKNLDILEFEVATLWKDMIDNDWYGGTHHFPNMTFGLMMSCFARIDLYSRYWRGTNEKQTLRMRDFLGEYVYPNRLEENRVAVQMWRHTLMHTSEPRRLRDRRTGMEYMWRVHFKEPLREEQHYTFVQGHDGTRILDIGIVYFVADLKHGMKKFLNDLNTDPVLQANYMLVDPDIRLQTF